jgi:hypothetical protein
MSELKMKRLAADISGAILCAKAGIAYHYQSLAIPSVVLKPVGSPERWDLMSELPYPAVSNGGGN